MSEREPAGLPVSEAGPTLGPTLGPTTGADAAEPPDVLARAGALPRQPEAPHAEGTGVRPRRPLARAWHAVRDPLPPPAPLSPPWRLVRLGLLAAWAAVFVWFCATRGIPFNRDSQVPWLLSFLVVAGVGRGWLRQVRIVVDWVPFLGFLFVYDFTRGLSSRLGIAAHYTPQIRADEVLFGGAVPTTWLQDHFYDPAHIAWWEVPVSLVYVSHFVVPWALAAALYVRSRDLWAAFARRLLVLSFAGLATFVVFPAAPPWLAAEHGYLPPVARLSGRGWYELHLHVAAGLINTGQALVNLVAAIPSLHGAFAALIVAFFWRRVHRGWRPLLAAYPVAMGFALVWSGEHYAIDVLLGWLYVLGTLAACRWWERRRGLPAG